MNSKRVKLKNTVGCGEEFFSYLKKVDGRFTKVILGIISFVIVILLLISNKPIDSKDFFDLGGQLFSVVAVAALGIWFADNNWKKALLFGTVTVPIFLLWNLSSPLKEVDCFADVILLKDGLEVCLLLRFLLIFTTLLSTQPDSFEVIIGSPKLINGQTQKLRTLPITIRGL